jgi:hypothetical protein
MLIPILVLCFVLAEIAIAIRANAALCHEDRVPMQWSIKGEVNWTAPRAVGLAFCPVVTVVVLCVFWFSSLRPTRLGQEHLVVPLLLTAGTVLTSVQLLHLWLVFKTLKRGGK